MQPVRDLQRPPLVARVQVREPVERGRFPSACQDNRAFTVAISCAYNLSETNNAAIPMAFTAADNYGIFYYEIPATSTGSATLDQCNKADDSVTSTTIVGAAVTIAGAKDVVIQAIVGSAVNTGPTSINSSYINLLATANTSSSLAPQTWKTLRLGTLAPTWTFSSTSTGSANACAFK